MCVNLTTLDDQCPDDECLLDHCDYGWIKQGHTSAVAFSRSSIWRVTKIREALRSGALNRAQWPTVPEPTIQKVIKAATTSRELSEANRRLLG